jgi:hypothetical protein
MDQKVSAGIWDPEMVGAALVAAFLTLDRLPPVGGPRGPGGHWPSIVTEWSDQLAQAELAETERRERQQTANQVRITPSALEITRMEMAFGWLRELSVVDSGMARITALWAHRVAQRRSIKRLCIERKWARHTFFRKRAKALGALAILLNMRGTGVF